MNPGRQEYFLTLGGLDIQHNTLDLNNFGGYGAQATRAFGPGNIFDGMFPDMLIKSPDQTGYYVHRLHLSRVSTNAFGGLLANPASSISVLEPAAVLNVVIHTIYGMSSTHRNPSLDTIEAAIDALLKYGVAPHLYAPSSQPLYLLLLLHAPYRPIEAYAVAGKYGFEDAAVAISGHLLAYDLSRISDELSLKMGPVYLRRLVDLHNTRAQALKNIVLRPPGPHAPTLTVTCQCECAGDQSRLANSWAYAAAQLVWATLPCMSTDALQSTFEKAGKEIVCEGCRAALRARIQEVCWRWFEVKTLRRPKRTPIECPEEHSSGSSQQRPRVVSLSRSSCRTPRAGTPDGREAD
ncbi:hypothetical protein V8D89_003167 [Ganoderma adspersum]